MDIIHQLQSLWGHLYDFLVVGVLGYLAKKWVADQVVRKWTEWKNSTPRTLAIWEHYNHRHDADHVLDCDQERCTIFRTYAS